MDAISLINMLLSVFCGGLEGAVTFVHLGGKNEFACVHAFQPDSNINLPVFLRFCFVLFYYSNFFYVFECMSV